MGFELIANRRVSSPRMTAGLHQKNVRFIFNAALITLLGWENVRCVTAAIGKGSSTGLLQLWPGPGFTMSRAGGDSRMRRAELRRAAFVEPPPRDLGSVECPFSHGPSINGLIITLPWSKAQMAALVEVFEAAS